MVTIDDSVFSGRLSLATGGGNDWIKIETMNGTSAPTVFEGPVRISLGGGTNLGFFPGTTDGQQSIVILSSFIVVNASEWGGGLSQVVFSFGGSIRFQN
jgi:hypothetical protein